LYPPLLEGAESASVNPWRGPCLAANRKKTENLKLSGGVMVPIVLTFSEAVSKPKKSPLCSKAGADCVGASLLA
jgi:hypothetical protein